MGLRCLLGHDFGEPETERERTEEGNEVVVSVREVKTCQRCGETQVVSENKEIKSIDHLRESVTGNPPAHEPETGAGMGESADFGAGESTGAQSGGPSPGADAADQWSADELELGGPADEPAVESEAEIEPAADDADDIDQGVAEIIENAEKDETLEQDTQAAADESSEEADADAEDSDETPVHPAKRGPDGDEPDEEGDSAHEEEDAVILDDEEPPEKGRGQWNEQAHPEEVPGRDKSGAEPRSPDDEDAIIMDDAAESADPTDTEPEEPTTEPEYTFTESEPEPEPEPEPATTEEQSTPEPSREQPTAVEDEDAEIMGSGAVDPEPESAPSQSTDVSDTTTEEPVAEDVETEESTDDGHMPWPSAPGEDEGHDAEPPDGEATDIEFGGGITPNKPENDLNGAESSASSSESPTAEPTATDPTHTESEPSRTEESSHENSGRSSPEPTINLEQSTREAGLEYYCTECGLTRDVGNSSMRAGDICPECRKGYITERQKGE